MAKKKVTLSMDEKSIKELKHKALNWNMTLSMFLEIAGKLAIRNTKEQEK